MEVWGDNMADLTDILNHFRRVTGPDYDPNASVGSNLDRGAYQPEILGGSPFAPGGMAGMKLIPMALNALAAFDHPDPNVLQGMIPTKSNLKDFNGIKDSIKEFLFKSKSGWADSQREAIAYMMARYPNRFNTVEGLQVVNPTLKNIRANPKDLLNEEGIKFVEGKASWLYDGPTANPPQHPQAQVKIRMETPTDSIPADYIPTLARESQHGVDSLRNDILYDIFNPTRADQAGRTALEGYKNYSQLQAEAQKESYARPLDDPYYKNLLKNMPIPGTKFVIK